MIYEKVSDAFAKKDSKIGITVNHIKEFLTNRDSISSDLTNRAEEVGKLQNELATLRQTIYELRRRELDRINKEFTKNDYSRRFNNVNIKTVIYALVGKEFSENEVNKQMKEYKVYLNKLELF